MKFLFMSYFSQCITFQIYILYLGRMDKFNNSPVNVCYAIYSIQKYKCVSFSFGGSKIQLLCVSECWKSPLKYLGIIKNFYTLAWIQSTKYALDNSPSADEQFVKIMSKRYPKTQFYLYQPETEVYIHFFGLLTLRKWDGVLVILGLTFSNVEII